MEPENRRTPLAVAIAGRPNAGKSTLFNALTGRMAAITDDHAGTTRDLVEASIELAGDDGLVYTVRLMDAGGMGVIDEPGIAPKIERAINRAVNGADVLVFLVDARTGITDLDLAAAERIRRLGKPVVVAANKCETEEAERDAHVFSRLGLGRPIMIAALEKRNIRELASAIIDAVKTLRPDAGAPPPENDVADVPAAPRNKRSAVAARRPGPMRIAVLGRRNCGKSTFVNALAGGERCIVSEIPGTTRDSVDVLINCRGRELLVIDTAGIARKREGARTVDFKSTVRTERAVRRADVVLLFIDCTVPVGRLERHAFRLVKENCKPAILTVNKWDLSTVSHKDFLRYLEKKLRFPVNLPVAFISALENAGVRRVVETAAELFELAGKRLGTGVLNRTLSEIAAGHGSPSSGTKTGRIFYATQTGVYPPVFTLFVNHADAFDEPYRRFVEKKLAAALGSEELPVKLLFRERSRRKQRRGRRR
ncbi:MAG TPA: ribosome biogenesis GTPase Der [Planctomycetes bacterium]|nr:ribosome biogenesis GTPase Der [Planctomycetota bacterium]